MLRSSPEVILKLPGWQAAAMARRLPGMIDQNASHHLGSDGKEMSAILPLHPGVVNQTQPGFVYESRRLQRVAGTFASHIAMSQFPEFAINDRCQAFECALISRTPGAQQLCHFTHIEVIRHRPPLHPYRDIIVQRERP